MICCWCLLLLYPVLVSSFRLSVSALLLFVSAWCDDVVCLFFVEVYLLYISCFFVVFYVFLFRLTLLIIYSSLLRDFLLVFVLFILSYCAYIARMLLIKSCVYFLILFFDLLFIIVI